MEHRVAGQPDVPDGGWTVPVRELLELPGLGLRVLAGDDSLDRQVSWAQVSEMADPTEFLRGGELLLLIGVDLPSGAEAQHAYVRRLAAAGVAAIGFGTGLYWDDVPAALIEAARQTGLPLLEVPRAVPFLAISRAVAQAISQRERAANEYLIDAQRALTAAAVGRGGLSAVLDEVHRLTDAWGLLLGRGGAVLAAAPPGAAEHRARLSDDLTRLRHAPGAASLVARDAGAETWVQSLTAGPDVLGYLAVGRATPLTATERQVVNAAVPLCTLSLDRSRLVGQGSRRLRSSVLRLLLAGQSGLVESVADELWNGLPAAPVTLLECRGPRFALVEARDRLVADRRLAAARVLYGELDETLVAVCAAESDEQARLVRSLAAVDGLRIGISGPTGYPEVGEARGQARRAAEYGTGPGTRVTWFRDIPRVGLLDLVAPDTAAEFATSVLRPLRDGEGAGPVERRAELLRSLRVWLAHHGQWDPAATELGVHRHTLRNRMRKVETLLGRTLDSPDLRAELWLALRLSARDSGSTGRNVE